MLMPVLVLVLVLVIMPMFALMLALERSQLFHYSNTPFLHCFTSPALHDDDPHL